MKAHKLMTPEQYAALELEGWHYVNKNADGMGSFGIRYGAGPISLETANKVLARFCELTDEEPEAYNVSPLMKAINSVLYE